ncbi:MAG TPA: ATP-binding protein [Symbiobacteriaceae bacterium]
MIISTRNLANERARRREARIRQLEQERDAREAAIFARIPRLAEIKREKAEIGLDLARLLLGKPTRYGRTVAELQERARQLDAEWEELLRRHHVDPHDLEVWWDCPHCKNTGWLPPEFDGDRVVRPARKCACLIQEEIEDLYRAAGITGPLREQTFERFDLTVYPPQDRDHMAKVLEVCQDFARRVAEGTQEESLLLTGDVGRGKTFLASAIANVALAARRSVVYFTFAEFLDLLRLAKVESNEEYMEGVQRLLDADLIILDDLGAEKVTDFVIQELFTIINHRMTRKRPMVISTNLTAAEIEQFYGERIASRLLYATKFVPLRGEDVRLVLYRRRTGR